jgi:hypothetical protein
MFRGFHFASARSLRGFVLALNITGSSHKFHTLVFILNSFPYHPGKSTRKNGLPSQIPEADL